MKTFTIITHYDTLALIASTAEYSIYGNVEQI